LLSDRVRLWGCYRDGPSAPSPLGRLSCSVCPGERWSSRVQVCGGGWHHLPCPFVLLEPIFLWRPPGMCRAEKALPSHLQDRTSSLCRAASPIQVAPAEAREEEGCCPELKASCYSRVGTGAHVSHWRHNLQWQEGQSPHMGFLSKTTVVLHCSTSVL
jgi:hypothetical protein